MSASTPGFGLSTAPEGYTFTAAEHSIAADSRAPTHIFSRQLIDAKPFLTDIYQNLNSLSELPVLIVWGQEDFAFQKPERMRFERLFTNHETIFLKNAGHFIQEDAPAEISIAIRKWYARY